MKKFVSIIIFIVYLLGSSYLAHANTMGVPFFDQQNNNEKEQLSTCEVTHSITYKSKSRQDSSELCFKKCLEQYEVLGSVNIHFEDIATHPHPHNDGSHSYSFFYNTLQNEYYTFSQASPGWTIPIVHQGYIGKTTILLI